MGPTITRSWGPSTADSVVDTTYLVVVCTRSSSSTWRAVRLAITAVAGVTALADVIRPVASDAASTAVPTLAVVDRVDIGAAVAAIAAMQGREVTRANGGELYTMVEELSRRANLPMPRVSEASARAYLSMLVTDLLNSRLAVL